VQGSGALLALKGSATPGKAEPGARRAEMRNQAEANLLALIESTEDLIWSVDLDYRKIVFNRALRENVENNFGTRVEAGMRAEDVLPPERAALWTPFYDRALAEGPFRTQYALVDGRTLELSFNPILVDGQATGVSVFGKDITKRKAAERNLRNAENKYHDIFEGAVEGMFQTGPDAGILTANPALAAMLGYDSPGELLCAITNVIDEVWADADEHVKFTELVEAQGFVRDFDCRLKRKDGSMVWTSLSCRRVCAADGSLLYHEGFLTDISERKASELALREAEERYRTIFDGANEGMFQTTLEGKSLSANPALARMLGYDSAEEVTEKVQDSAHDVWVDPEERAQYLRLLEQRPMILGYECQYKRKDGSRIWVSLNVRKVCDADGRVLYLEGFIQDITAHKEAVEALTEREERFRRFFEENGCAMLLVDPASGAIVDANDAAASFYAIGREELIGRLTGEMSTLGSEESALDRQLALGKKRRVFNYRIRLKSGEERAVEAYASPVSLGGKQVLFCIVHDITERLRTEEALRESLETLKEAQTVGALGSYVLDIRTGVWTSSDLLDELFGIDESYATTVDGWTALIHPGDRAMMASYFANEVIGGKKTFDKEYRIVHQSDGTERWVHGRGKLEFDALGRPVKMRGVIRDITERKQADLKLRASEERYRATFEQAAVGITHTSFDGKFLRCNARFAEIIGYPLEEIPGMSFHQITAPEDQAHSEKVRLQMAGGADASSTWEKRYLRKDGRLTWVKVTVSTQRDTEGEPLYHIVLVEDINARKEAEARLAAATEALRLSETHYRTIFQTSVDGICISQVSDGRFIDANKKYLDMVGFEREEVIGRTSEELNLWAGPEIREQLFDTNHQQEGFHGQEVLCKRRNGDLYWAEVSAAPIEIGGVPCFLSIVRDISAAKAAQDHLAATTEALRLSEAHYRTVFQTSVDGICISQFSDGQYIDANPAFLDLFGYAREELIGRTSFELNFWTDPDVRRRMADLLTQGSSIRDLEMLARKKDGSTIWIQVSASAIEIEDTPCVLSIVRDVSAAKAAEEQLAAAQRARQASEARYQAAFETTSDSVTISRLADGVYIECNQAFLDSLGYEREEVIGHTSLELDIWPDRSEREHLTEDLREHGICRELEARFRKKSGEILWAQMSASIMTVDGADCVLCIARDISAAKAAEERLAAAQRALQASETRYRTAFQTSIDAININRMSDGCYVECNEAFLNIMGFERHEVIGKTSLELNIWANPRDRKNLVEILRQYQRCGNIEAQFRKRNGEVFWGEMSASVIEIEGVPCILSITRDISGAKVAEDEIRTLAFYDPLTRLPNRRLVSERLRQTLAVSARSGKKGALLFIDLDDFKTLNDTLGHKTGDLLLQEVGRRLTQNVRDADTVARLGGDEFVVILEDLSESLEEAASQARSVAEKILASICQTYLLAGRECLSTSSIGITMFGDRTDAIDEVLQQADIAMYQAKTAGRNTLRFFAPALQAAIHARASMEEDLRQAIGTGQFQLYYQPQVEAGVLIGAEALLRWKHPQRGFLPPGDFIPLAEETGLILPLGDWVLETACRQIAEWARSKEAAHITVAVNISARQLRQPDFVEQVLSVLYRTGANPKNLDLELTESMLVENVEEVIAKMSALKAHGLRFSLDDFGTGYSSLAYLKRLPLNQLKIDRAFVHDMQIDVTSGAIAQTIISLGRAMGLSVIAEGVETEEQRDFLAGMGCHAFQGFLFSRPLPLEDFQLLLPYLEEDAADALSEAQKTF